MSLRVSLRARGAFALALFFGGAPFAPAASPQATSAQLRPTAAAALVKAPDSYRLVDLGPVVAMALNDTGAVVGFRTGSNGQRSSFVWRRGRFFELPAPDGVNGTMAYALNSRDEVVGVSYMVRNGDVFGLGTFYDARPVLWKDGGVTPIALPAPYRYGIAVAINDRGEVLIAPRMNTSAQERALLWDGPRLIDLGTLHIPPAASSLTPVSDDPSNLKYDGSEGYALNDSDAVVGRLIGVNQLALPFLWRSGTLQPLDTLPDPGAQPGFRDAFAFAINRRGHILGEQFLHDATGLNPHLILWGDAGPVDLGRTAFTAQEPIETNVYRTHRALGNQILNDHDEVVSSDDGEATIWRKGDRVKLSSLVALPEGVHLSAGVAINNAGSILAAGTADGKDHSFLLIPLPPSPSRPPATTVLASARRSSRPHSVAHPRPVAHRAAPSRRRHPVRSYHAHRR